MQKPKKVAIVVIREEGLDIARKLHQTEPDWHLWGPKITEPKESEFVFEPRFKDWLKNHFDKYDGFVCFMAAGIVVRALSPLVKHKTTDPGVVVSDEYGRQAISLLGGHEGGANNLAYCVANAIGAVPVITTGTEALKEYVLGIGCRKNASYQSLHKLVTKVLNEVNVTPEQIRCISTIDLKKEEPCILKLAETFQCPIRIFSQREIIASDLNITSSEFVENMIGVPGVCEPTSLMASHYGNLIVEKTTEDGCAVALVKESSVHERKNNE